MSNTENTRAIITKFAEVFYKQKNVAEAFNTFIADEYIQHSPLVVDGRDAAITMLQPKFGNAHSNFSIKKIVVDDDIAIIHLHGIIAEGSLGVAVMDMYRIKDNLIVEHWDVVQPIPAEKVNPRSMF